MAKYSITQIPKPVVALLLVLILALVFFLMSASFKAPLIEKIPKDAEFWIWQNKKDLSSTLALLLKEVGIEDRLIALLNAQNHEIVIYKHKDRWHKIEDKNTVLPKGLFLKSHLWENLYEDGSPRIIGFLNSEYINNLIPTPLLFSEKQTFYYFVIKAIPVSNPELLRFGFTIIPEDKILAIKKKPLPRPQIHPVRELTGDAGYGPDSFRFSNGIQEDVLFAFSSQDKTLVNKVGEEIKEQIINSVSFKYPVIVETLLPDHSAMQEKIAKPDLFNWVEIEPNKYDLELNQAKAQELDVMDQLQNISMPFRYHEDKNGIFITLPPHQNVPLPNSLLYFNLQASTVYIEDENDFLRWLQDFGVKSIIVEEDLEGVMEGEIRFK